MAEGGVVAIRTRNMLLGADQTDYPNAALVDYVALEVADNGEGLDPQLMGRVFEPFFTTKPAGEGAGLGLLQVHGLAVQSGGDVRIVSRKGFGTTVTVLLPRAAEGAQRQETGVGRRRSACLRPLHVLVVDDDWVVREMIAEMLQERGHSVVAAVDGADALAILDRPAPQAPPFDLMLVDYVMPGMNGVSLIQAAQVLHPGLRALLVTGNAGSQTSELIDAEMVMRKPFTIAELEERVARLLEEGRAEIATLS